MGSVPVFPEQVNEHGQIIDEKILKKNRTRFSFGFFLHPGVYYGLGWGIPSKIIKAFGGTDAHIGVLGGANAGIASLFQFLGTFVLGKTRSDRKALVYVISAGLLVIFLTALTILGMQLDSLKTYLLRIFLGLLISMAAVNAAFANVESSWIGDLVPRNRLGWFTSLKWIFLNIGNFIFQFAFAKLADAHPTAKGYALLYFIVVAALLTAIVIYSRATDREPRRIKNAEGAAQKEHLNYASRVLWCYVLFYVLWAIGRTLWVTFSAIYLIEQFNFSMMKLAWLNSLQLLISCIVIYFLGKLSDFKGNRSILILVSGFIALCMYLWVGSAWMGVVPIIVYTIINGAAGQTHTMLATNLGLEIFPDKGRSAYLAFSRLFIGITAFIAPLVAGKVMSLFHDIKVNVHGTTLNRYHIVFFVASSITFTCILPLFIMGNKKVE